MWRKDAGCWMHYERAKGIGKAPAKGLPTVSAFSFRLSALRFYTLKS
jgi:hypothetical protein